MRTKAWVRRGRYRSHRGRYPGASATQCVGCGRPEARVPRRGDFHHRPSRALAAVLKTVRPDHVVVSAARSIAHGHLRCTVIRELHSATGAMVAGPLALGAPWLVDTHRRAIEAITRRWGTGDHAGVPRALEAAPVMGDALRSRPSPRPSGRRRRSGGPHSGGRRRLPRDGPGNG